MTAVVQDRYGSTAVLANRSIARPEITNTQVPTYKETRRYDRLNRLP